MPYPGFVMPSFPGSPRWEMEAPQFRVPGPVPVPVPVPYLDRTNSDGALVHGPANGFEPPSPGQKLTRRASLGNWSTALRSPGSAAGGRGQGSLELQIRSELQQRDTMSLGVKTDSIRTCGKRRCSADGVTTSFSRFANDGH
jgi:hypothetical protein